MSLNKSKYNNIIEKYALKRNLAIKNANELKQKFTEDNPDYQKIDDEIRKISLQFIRNNFRDGDKKESLVDYNTRIKKLTDKKKEYLKSKGLKEDAFEPKFECKICKDTGFVDGKQCSCLKKQVADELFNTSHLGEILNEENFTKYNLDYYSKQVDKKYEISPYEKAKEAYNYSWNFINDFDSVFNNIIIKGNTGVGKTFLAHCIAKELIDRGKSVAYYSSTKFFKVLSDEHFNHVGEDLDVKSEEFENCDLLIIDDLGTELNNSFTESAFFEIINERILDKKSVIISTNLNIKSIRDRYSDRVCSRISQHYDIIDLIGEDIRRQKSMED